MFGLRVLGHSLLWIGFLSASVGMVMQRELDLLPVEERTALLQLPADFSIPADLATQVAGKSWTELDSAQFLAILQQALAPTQSAPASETAATVPGTPQPNPATDSVESATELAAAPKLNKTSLIQQRTKRVASLWPTVNWLVYGPAVIVGILGVVLLRKSAQKSVDVEVARTKGLDPLRRSLTQLIAEVQKLEDQMPAMTPESVVAYIDERCVEHCNSFADQREHLKSAFGLVGFGEVMSEFASGERFLNRVWSAAADGYMEEAYRSVQTSLGFFQAAQRQMDRKP